MIPRQPFNIYIASCDKNGGIYHYILDSEGKLWQKDVLHLDRPMYMTIHDNKMYILLRSPFKNEESGLVTYDIQSNGTLCNPSDIISTKGQVACHIAWAFDNVYCTNYISGSVIKMPNKLVSHEGCGINPTRQTSPHTHFVYPTPCGKYMCVCDLGIDTIFVYDKDLCKISDVKVPSGHGVRHLVFSDDGKYAFSANELKSTISAFSYDRGRFELLDTISGLCNEDVKSDSAAIRYRDRHIYVSNRGRDTISKLSFDGKNLFLDGEFSSRGKSPRDFDFVGDFMICTNQDSDNVSVIDMKNNEYNITDDICVKSPLCVVYKK